MSRYQKCKTNLDFTEARDSEWQWHQLGHMQVCISLQTDNHASTPPLCFLQAGCPSCRQTNGVKAIKAELHCSIEMKGLIHGSNSTAMLIAKLYLPIVFSCSKSSPKALFWNRWKTSHQQATGKSSSHGKWQPAMMGLFVCATNYTHRELTSPNYADTVHDLAAIFTV